MPRLLAFGFLLVVAVGLMLLAPPEPPKSSETDAMAEIAVQPLIAMTRIAVNNLPDEALRVENYRMLPRIVEPSAADRRDARTVCRMVAANRSDIREKAIRACASIYAWMGAGQEPVGISEVPKAVVRLATVCWRDVENLLPKDVFTMLASAAMVASYQRLVVKKNAASDPMFEIMTGTIEALERYDVKVQRATLVASACTLAATDMYRRMKPSW